LPLFPRPLARDLVLPAHDLLVVWEAAVTWEATVVVLAALAGQAFWIAWALGKLRDDVRDLRDDLGGRLDRVDDRLDRIECTLLRDHGERIARLEERTGA
jgi:hypothetical protein